MNDLKRKILSWNKWFLASKLRLAEDFFSMVRRFGLRRALRIWFAKGEPIDPPNFRAWEKVTGFSRRKAKTSDENLIKYYKK